jgi:hypothetical protein
MGLILLHILAVAGFGCIIYGVALWSRPVAWVVTGLMAVAVVLLSYPRDDKHGVK